MTDDGRLYRYGFCVSSIPIPDPPLPGWQCLDLGPATVWLHPEAEVRQVDGEGSAVLLIGKAFAISGSLELVLRSVLAAPAGDPGLALHELSGRYALLVARAGEVEVYHDPFGSRTIYYSPSAPGTAASHAELLARLLRREKRGDVEAFRASGEYSKLSVKYLPGDLTVYEDIFGLVPNHRLELGRSGAVRYWPEERAQKSSLADFRARLDVYGAALAEFCRQEPVAIGISAGVDTRLVFSILHAHGIPFESMTWLGPYCSSDEIPVIDEIVRRLGLPHRYVEVPGLRDEVAALAGRNSGNFRGSSRLTSAVAAQLPQLADTQFLRGYGGEILRGFYNLDRHPIARTSAEEFARVYLRKLRGMQPGPGIVAFTREAFTGFIDRAHYAALDTYGYDVNDLFYWEQRMGMWGAAMLNEMDAAMPSMVALNDRRLYQIALGLPPGVRLTKAFLNAEVARATPLFDDLPLL